MSNTVSAEAIRLYRQYRDDFDILATEQRVIDIATKKMMALRRLNDAVMSYELREANNIADNLIKINYPDRNEARLKLGYTVIDAATHYGNYCDVYRDMARAERETHEAPSHP